MEGFRLGISVLGIKEHLNWLKSQFYRFVTILASRFQRHYGSRRAGYLLTSGLPDADVDLIQRLDNDRQQNNNKDHE